MSPLARPLGLTFGHEVQGRLRQRGKSAPPTEKTRTSVGETLLSRLSWPGSLQRRQSDVAEEDLGPFGLEEDLALAGLGAAALVDDHAIHFQFDGVALAGDDVLVPLADGLLDA